MKKIGLLFVWIFVFLIAGCQSAHQAGKETNDSTAKTVPAVGSENVVTKQVVPNKEPEKVKQAPPIAAKEKQVPEKKSSISDKTSPQLVTARPVPQNSPTAEPIPLPELSAATESEKYESAKKETQPVEQVANVVTSATTESVVSDVKGVSDVKTEQEMSGSGHLEEKQVVDNSVALAEEVSATPAQISEPEPTKPIQAQEQPKNQALVLKKEIVSKQAVLGQMKIDFTTRSDTDSDGNPKLGAFDKYALEITAGNTVKFSGQITRKPRIISKVLGREQQAAELAFNINSSVMRTDNPLEEKKVAKWQGVIPIDAEGRYLLTGPGGTPLQFQVSSVGTLAAFTDVFSGIIIGKNEEKRGLLGAKMHEYARFIRGKKVAVQSKHIDPLSFENVFLAAGPLPIFPRTKVKGNLDYDYDTGNWYTNGITFEYELDGKRQIDRLSGSIKWVEDARRLKNGKGYYEFNLRFNEKEVKPMQDEASFFAPSGEDEEAFFEVDETIPALTGRISYLDTFDHSAGEDDPLVVSSKVTYDLKSHLLNQQQIVNFVKLWLLIVGPVNDE